MIYTLLIYTLLADDSRLTFSMGQLTAAECAEQTGVYEQVLTEKTVGSNTGYLITCKGEPVNYMPNTYTPRHLFDSYRHQW